MREKVGERGVGGGGLRMYIIIIYINMQIYCLKIIHAKAVILLVCRSTIFLVLLVDYIKRIAVGTLICGALLVCSGCSDFLILLLQVYLSDCREKGREIFFLLERDHITMVLLAPKNLRGMVTYSPRNRLP